MRLPEIFYYILIFCAGFAVGSIPFSFIITKLVAKKDIRTIGSGNPGATNVVRATNRKFGLLALFLDVMKGFVPVMLAMGTGDRVLVGIMSLAVVLGHDYSIFLGFKGGKGVATSLGIFCVLAPVPTLVVAIIFTMVTSVFKFVSLGSVLASIAYPFVSYLLGYTEYLWLAIVLGLLIIYKHKSNLSRLWNGNENRSVF